MSQWQTVFKTDKAYQAEIVNSVLIDNNIHAVIINKQDSSYHFGFYEVSVGQEDVLDAMQIIENDINFK